MMKRLVTDSLSLRLELIVKGGMSWVLARRSGESRKLIFPF